MAERLAVTRPVYELTDVDVGPREDAFLILIEVDENGLVVANVRWDVEDLGAAYAELDARWQDRQLRPRAPRSGDGSPRGDRG